MNAANPAILGEHLQSLGLLSKDQLRAAHIEQRAQGGSLATILARMGFVSEATLNAVLAAQAGQQSVDLQTTIPDPRALAAIPQNLAERLGILPLAWSETSLTIAMAQAHDLPVLDQLQRHLEGRATIEVRLAPDSDIRQALTRYYGHARTQEEVLHELESNTVSADGFIRLVDAILLDAASQQASDLHFEPEQHYVRIRYRIDGVLQQIRVLHRNFWPPMLVRLKVMAGMNIAETRAPQDGRMSLTLAGRLLDFRVAAQPTIWGENLVLRVLDRQKGLLPLSELGLPADSLARLEAMMARPEGLFLLTGPTGAGKTTTLYSILARLSTEAVNIMTLEDPVEYPLPLLRQTSLNEGIKLDFASGIRALLRQDPDIILIGEIRDRETAEMALRAAMTGHQVFATLHTASAIGAIPRLYELGIPPDVLAGNLIGIVAQRLVRQLCPHCKQASAESSRIYRAQGCPSCRHGYRGRLAMMEILPGSAELDELIARRAPRHEITTLMQTRRLPTLGDEAQRLLRAGATSLDEITRVLGRQEEARPCI